jgi:hypothetical protein
MRRDILKTLLIVFCISFFHLFTVHPASSQETGLTAGGFQWGGSVELGYRIENSEGNKDRYKEVVNLENGLKLMDFSLWGRRTDDNAKSLVDSLRFNLSGIGDPYPSGRLEIKKDKTYALNVTYKQYKYFTSRDEIGLFADNTNFDTTIRRGSVVFSFFPKDDVKLNVGYTHTQRDGDAGVPRFGFFFPMDQEIKEHYNEYFISADFPIGGWDFHVRQSLWNYLNKNKIDGPKYEERDEFVRTYVSSIKGHTQLGERWDFDAAFIYAHSNGKADLASVPIVAVDPGTGKMNFNTYVIEAGLSYRIRKDVILHADYQFHSQNQDGRANTDPFVSAPAYSGTEFNMVAHTGTFQLEYIPMDNLTLRGGYRLQFQDINGDNYVDNIYNGGRRPSNTTIWTQGWVASADWKPYKFLSFFGEYNGAHFSNPYTWISPENQNVARVKIKYDTPIKNLSLKGTFVWKQRVNPDQDYRSDVQDYVLTAIYQPIQQLSVDASFTYEKNRNSKDIFNSIPYTFEHTVFNSSATIWSGSATFDLYKGFGGRIYGSYAKSLTENPQNYADGVISFWYKNKWVTPILTFERTYLTDRVNSKESFDTNLITFSLRKDF